MSDNKMNNSFEDDLIELAIDQIMPFKLPNKSNFTSQKFDQIVASIREIGIIEPFVITSRLYAEQNFCNQVSPPRCFTL